MEHLKRGAAIYLFPAAAVVVAQMVISPFYRNVVDVGDIWHVMNWFMAASIIITLIVRTHDRIQLKKEKDNSVSRRYLETYAGLIVGVFLALWFFWNWGSESITFGGEASQINLIFWSWINPLFVIVTGLTACRLWNRP